MATEWELKISLKSRQTLASFLLFLFWTKGLITALQSRWQWERNRTSSSSSLGREIRRRLDYFVLNPSLDTFRHLKFSKRQTQDRWSLWESKDLIENFFGLLTHETPAVMIWRAAAKVPHSCLFWARFRMVPRCGLGSLHLSFYRSSTGVIRSASVALSFWCLVWGFVGVVTRVFP